VTETEARQVNGDKNRTLRFVTGQPYAVAAGTGLLSAVIATAPALLGGSWSDWWVVFAAAWGIVLALAIYFISSSDTDQLIARSDNLAEQVAELVNSTPDSTTTGDLQDRMHEFRHYFDALVSEYPMPPRAIVGIDRPGAGKGNRPVVFATAKGKRYSVWRGGRGGGWTVTKLPAIESD